MTTTFEKHLDKLAGNKQMPVLFVGHGSPMNAIEDNEFTQNWKKIGKKLPKPQAILCISAHWKIPGTYITSMLNPPTIHDFDGFPRELFDIQYPAPGNPARATEIKRQVSNIVIGLENKDWGLDHGSWSVLKHLYPKADIPVIQMSLFRAQTPKYHYELGKHLSFLRRKGVLIVCTGNIVHNMRTVDWGDPASEYGWAQECNDQIKKWLVDGNHQQLMNFRSYSHAFDMAIPTIEHYIPLLYTIGLQDRDDQISIFNDKIVMGSISMTSVMIG
jgi:4,5-DOPA dioxygenase extradiol